MAGSTYHLAPFKTPSTSSPVTAPTSPSHAPDPQEPGATEPQWSSRRLTAGRRLLYRLLVPLGKLVMEVTWRTARLRIIGEEALVAAVQQHGQVIPLCWHQHLLVCSRYTVAGRVPGMKPGFLISPSVDGEAPSMLARTYGAQVVRGSSTHTGPRAIRFLCKALAKDGVSPLMTPDGPRGPRFEFKAGAVLISQLSGVPMVPLAFAARPAKVFRTWDKFILPAPFSRMVVAVGEPVIAPRHLDETQREALRQEMQQRMLDTYLQAKAALEDPSTTRRQ